MTTELPREKDPGRAAGWTHIGPGLLPRSSIWHRGKIRVVSSLDLATMPDGKGDVGPQWHISITTSGHRPKPEHVAVALRAFGMVAAEEDNHHPGEARHFFLVVDPARRVACECKATEETVVEADGYRWTTPTAATGEECRGCEWQRETGKPCPVHAVLEGPPPAGSGRLVPIGPEGRITGNAYFEVVREEGEAP